MRRFVGVCVLVLTCALLAPVAGKASAAAPAGLPSHSAVMQSAKLAADYYDPTFAHTTVGPKNGWSWATYYQGLASLYRQAGDARYLADAMAWGQANAWALDTTGTNPDTVKAGEVYYALNGVDPTASLAAMDSRMATDLTALPVSQYDWIDALFMGLPDWALWARRTGNPAYLDKMDALFTWARDRGATGSRCASKPINQPGLVEMTAALWYRDCTFVRTRDANGQLVFWGRGNGWVVAALADVVQQLPKGDPRADKYATMLRSMATALARLQGQDGFWRASLLDPALLPQPETSGTALITYALASGVRSGVLDAATFTPVVARAWQGLSTLALRPSGFVADCQPPGVSPAAAYTGSSPRVAPTPTSSGSVNLDSPPYCVGALLLAASEVAQLSSASRRTRPPALAGTASSPKR